MRVKIEVVAVLFLVLTAQCSAEQHTANEPVLFSNECASLTSYFSARSDRIPKKERKKENSIIGTVLARDAHVLSQDTHATCDACVACGRGTVSC